MLNRKFWKQENVNFYSGWKKALLLVNLEIPSIRLHHRSWDSMTHSTCTIILPCLVRCSCRKNLQQRKPFSVIQKINKNVKFWHSLKVKPWFLILLTNLNTGATQWRVGVGRQRDAKVREAGERGTGSARRENPTPPPPTTNDWQRFITVLFIRTILPKSYPKQILFVMHLKIFPLRPSSTHHHRVSCYTSNSFVL